MLHILLLSVATLDQMSPMMPILVTGSQAVVAIRGRSVSKKGSEHAEPVMDKSALVGSIVLKAIGNQRTLRG